MQTKTDKIMKIDLATIEDVPKQDGNKSNIITLLARQ